MVNGIARTYKYEEKFPVWGNLRGLKILVCPLNWGLGHATRCVPLIRQLEADGHEVVLVADGYPLEFLKQEFPALRTIEKSSYNIRYSAGSSQILAMLRSIPKIIYGIYSEHKWLKNLLKTEHFDKIISDNRFGLWSNKTECVYITHQLMIKMPKGLQWLEKTVWRLHRNIIHKYTECFIPDFEGNENLSGDLSHKYPLPRNAQFIGPLSRFQNIEIINPDRNFDVVAVISGLEPQRTILEQQIVERYQNSDENVLILLGKPAKIQEKKNNGNITLLSHTSDAELAGYLTSAKKIIARSGYSTIMDLHALNCIEKTEFIPTPGQTEQEYLHEFLRVKIF